MPSAADELGRVVRWTGETFRLIPSRFPPVPVYQGLVDNGRLPDLTRVEELTNPRLRSQSRIAAAAGEDPKTSARLQNWNLAPFAYGNPEGSIFFDEERPCLEVATDPQTALAISVAKRERFLERTGEAAIGLDMRMFKTPVDGRFLDLRAVGAAAIATDGRVFGRRFPSDADGIIYRPAERPTGTAISIVRGDVLGRTLQTVHYRYDWNGQRISLLYAFDREGAEIKPDDLRGETDCLAA